MSRTRLIVLSAVLDAVLVNVSFIVAFLLRFGGDIPAFNFGAYVGLWPLITALYLGCGYTFGLYEPQGPEGRWELARATFLAVALGTVLTVAVAFFAGPRFFSFSRLAIVIAWVLQLVLLIGWRMALFRAWASLWPEQRVLIVGTGVLAAEVAEGLTGHADRASTVVGFISPGEGAAPAVDPALVLGTFRDVGPIVAGQRVNRIIVSSPVAVRELIEDLMLAATSGVRVEVVPEFYEIMIGTVDRTVRDIPLMELTRMATPSRYAGAKRLFDLVFSLLLLVVLSPLIAIVALGVLLSMGRPVLFTQERVGRGLVPFTIVKFRTMVRDAEASSGPVLAEEDDARITALGRVLRRFRIDELPQLVNILAGHMSFVGPRPERPYFVERYLREIPGYRERFKVKPGVTGLAQVGAGYATGADRKLKFDLMYVYHQTLLLDLQILAETLRVVITGRGAR